ncbi:MAG TPA: hypothetical protein VGD37_37475 [Kofleriaceae bacterium]|jgi:CO/xanthine dehydrogenase FAD-binding subunit
MRYHRATSLAGAIAQLGDGAIPLAGGTVIVPEAVRRGEGPDVVDIADRRAARADRGVDAPDRRDGHARPDRGRA